MFAIALVICSAVSLTSSPDVIAACRAISNTFVMSVPERPCVMPLMPRCISSVASMVPADALCQLASSFSELSSADEATALKAVSVWSAFAAHLEKLRALVYSHHGRADPGSQS